MAHSSMKVRDLLDGEKFLKRRRCFPDLQEEGLSLDKGVLGLELGWPEGDDSARLAQVVSKVDVVRLQSSDNTSTNRSTSPFPKRPCGRALRKKALS